MKNGLLREIRAHLPEMAPEALRELLARMDEDYLSLCRPSEIADHLRMSRTLRPRTPVKLQITQEDSEHFRLVIVAETP